MVIDTEGDYTLTPEVGGHGAAGEDMGEQVEQTHERDPFHDLESQDMSPGLATAGILVATGVVKATLLGPLAFFLGPVGMFVKRQITGIFGHETKE